ncbi:MAG: hypothetical protein ACERKZ_12595 [Lachnotalea sp.]
MMCKSFKSTRFYVAVLFLGVVLFAFGLINATVINESAHNTMRLMGIITGVGAGFAGVSIAKLIHRKITSPEKLKQEQIELKDERNIQILRIAYTISNVVAALLFAGLVILFSAIGSTKESYLCLGALSIQQIAFWIAYQYYKKKI